ncbi:MAG TPA: hypothetical protein VGV64_02035, partial [Thermoplasmata archaeon]|nr:hypothetical protein [Thermoplasmata archaeon]
MDGAEGSSERPRPGTAPTISLPNLLWLLAVAAALAFVLLEPLLSFPLFGSDTGEYYRLSQSIALSGHLPGSYGGWGSAYPDFPGTFLLTAAASGATGSDLLVTLTVAIPLLAALSIVPLFLLFRRIFPNDTIAIVGAGLASLAFPRTFSLAHPAPLALGDLLVVAALWMFVEGRRDARWYLPLGLTAGALIVTHHLSSYFFVVSALGSLVLLELWRPRSWSRRFPGRELAFLLAFLLGLFADWFEYARSFLPTVSEGSLGNGPGEFLVFEGVAVGGIALAGLAIRACRARPIAPLTVRMPSDRSVARDFLLILAASFVGIAILLAYPLPGTHQTTTASAVLYFSPVLALASLAAGTRRLVTASRIGPLVLAWTAVVGLSALVALATSDPTLSPARHAEYLVIPLGLLVAVGLGRLVARWGDARGRGAFLAGGIGIVLLLAANGAVAYPPPADLGGFQEGLTPGDAALYGWVGMGLPPNATV